MKNFNELNIRYNNIHPTDSERVYIESIFKELYDESPYGAVLSGSFTDRKGTVKGTLQINSSAGSFFATAETSNINEVTRMLMVQIKRRLEKWKSRRFRFNGNKHFDSSVA
jgi:hypothetical protein